MSNLPRLSGLKITKVLTKEFGFSFVRQTGSHVMLRKFVEGRKVVTVVPMHKEVKHGTLMGILDLVGVKKEDFVDKL